MINNSEFHSPEEFKISSFSEFHSSIFGIPLLYFRNSTPPIFGIPLPNLQIWGKNNEKNAHFRNSTPLKSSKFSHFRNSTPQKNLKILYSEFHSPWKQGIFGIPLLLFSEFHSPIFGIPLSSKWALSPLNKGINGFLKSILKYNKSLFYF